jgi:hypothetical protein
MKIESTPLGVMIYGMNFYFICEFFFFFLEALRMWEACWSHYQTDYFHLFICISIMAVYGDDIVQQNLGTDDMLLHFNSLAMHMSGSIVLKKVKE